MTDVERCSWALGSAAMTAYHDEEWGVPQRDPVTNEAPAGAMVGELELTIARRAPGNFARSVIGTLSS